MMGLLVNVPVALAPGMGLNGYFAALVASGQMSFKDALGAVFISGIFYLVLTVTGLRAMVFRAVPPSMRAGITVGIGCVFRHGARARAHGRMRSWPRFAAHTTRFSPAITGRQVLYRDDWAQDRADHAHHGQHPGHRDRARCLHEPRCVGCARFRCAQQARLVLTAAAPAAGNLPFWSYDNGIVNFAHNGVARMAALGLCFVAAFRTLNVPGAVRSGLRVGGRLRSPPNHHRSRRRSSSRSF